MSLCLARFGYLGQRKGQSKPRTGKPHCGLFIVMITAALCFSAQWWGNGRGRSNRNHAWYIDPTSMWSLENNILAPGPNKQNLWSTEIVCLTINVLKPLETMQHKKNASRTKVTYLAQLGELPWIQKSCDHHRLTTLRLVCPFIIPALSPSRS